MGKRFLPSLRGLPTSDTDGGTPEQASEAKSLTVTGYTSTTNLSRSTGGVYGTEGRADHWDMDAVISEGYERDVWVFRCVELIAGHASRLPFVAGRNIGQDNEERLEHHALYRVMNKRANPLETGRAFRKRLSAMLLLSKKGAFVEVIKSRAGNIVRLDLLDPSRVRVIPDENGDNYIKHFEYTRRDGAVREIPVERVRWIREPHPTDPFSGVTPLEAAGMSVELDFLSRLYNVSFIKNDSRPGGVLAVDTESLDDREMDRIERKFKPGAQHAGEMTVIGTGPGGANYIDSTTKPRDMSYAEAAKNARDEVLAAFGVGESLLGNAAGRTYDNAESELYNFYTQVLMPHLQLIADAFDGDFDEYWDPFFDVSGIEVLELPRRRDREEARQEFMQGLRSMDEYRPLAKLPQVNTAQSRALWLNPSKAPVPGRPEDAAALGLGPGGEMGPDGMPPEGGPGPEGAPDDGSGGGTAVEAVAEARAEQESGHDPAQDPVQDDEQTLEDLFTVPEGGGGAASAVEEARGQTGGLVSPGDAAAAVEEARDTTDGNPEPGDAADAVRRARKLEGKALAMEDATVVADLDPSTLASLEMTLQAMLEAGLARQLGVILARLESPKTRKGTKFWAPENDLDTRVGDEPVNAEKVTSPDQWEKEALESTLPVTEQGAQEAAGALFEQLVAAGVIIGGAAGAGAAASAGAAVVGGIGKLAALLVGGAVREFIDEVTDLIRARTVTATTIVEVQDAVRSFYAEESHRFAKGVALSAAAAAINGARDAAVTALVPAPSLPSAPVATTRMLQEWNTAGDEKVRPAHRAMAGQLRDIGAPFAMDGLPARFPGDPLLPPALRFGCRCSVRYKVSAEARLFMPPGD